MCGRFNLTDSPLVHALLEDLGINIGPLPVRYNIAPTENIPVVFRREGINQLAQMRWWLVPSWSDGPNTKFAMFNARAETLETTKAYKGLYRHQRAIIPASSFIEWKKEGAEKQPYLIEGKDNALAFAGLWDHWSDGAQALYSCTIITTNAAPQLTFIHKRMPLMLSADQFEPWLNCKPVDMTPKFTSKLRVCPINKSVNNSRNKEAITSAGSCKEIQ